MEQKIIQSQRGKVYYWIARNANPEARCLVFLHGLTADHTLFDKQITCFSEKYTVLAWDAPAHGCSRPYSDFSYAHLAEDLNAILDAENMAQVVMIGQSMGGYVIQAFAKDFPQRLAGFVGIDTCPFGHKYYSKSDLWWLRQVGWMSYCYPYKLLIYSIAKSCTRTVEAFENMKQALQNFHSKLELCRTTDLGYRGFIAANCDLKLTCPVVLLVGEHDKTGKVKDYCCAWQASEGYPLYFIPNAAHNSNFDNPKEVNRIISNFLKDNNL